MATGNVTVTVKLDMSDVIEKLEALVEALKASGIEAQIDGEAIRKSLLKIKRANGGNLGLA